MTGLAPTPGTDDRGFRKVVNGQKIPMAGGLETAVVAFAAATINSTAEAFAS